MPGRARRSGPVRAAVQQLFTMAAPHSAVFSEVTFGHSRPPIPSPAQGLSGPAISREPGGPRAPHPGRISGAAGAVQRHGVQDTIVFMGSARLQSAEAAQAALAEAERTGEGVEKARTALTLSAYYEAARELAHRLTAVVEKARSTRSGASSSAPAAAPASWRPPIAARRRPRASMSASPSRSPMSEFDNPYVSRELHIHFHYFFMRKFWFVYLAKAVVLFPGGFGTLDEMFEILTLVQTRKMKKRMPIVLFGAKFWDEVVEFRRAGALRHDQPRRSRAVPSHGFRRRGLRHRSPAASPKTRSAPPARCSSASASA